MENIQTFFGYHRALMRLLRGQAFNRQDKNAKLAALCELCGSLLAVDEVSIWCSSVGGGSLHRQVLYRFDKGLEQAPLGLEREQHPEYFVALEQGDIINVDDARQDPRTRSFCGTYLEAQGTISMLDAPIFDDGRLGGVVCLESSRPRHWHLADIAFVTAIADTISLLNTHEAWRQSRQQLDYLAHYDELTGLHNHRAFSHCLDGLIQSNRPKTPFALLWIDIDRLHVINNGMGVMVGNAVLNEMASRLKESCLPGKEMVARVGGDEFALICRLPVDEQAVGNKLKTLLEWLSRPVQQGRQKLQVSVSIGIARYPSDGDDTGTLLRHSEAAMYHAKSLGRRQVCYFNQDISSAARERFLLERQLTEAIEQDQLIVHYQPLVDTAGIQVVTAEALIRWPHPELGMISPAGFLPLAQEAGLMARLDLWVLTRVCRDQAAARAQQRWMPPTSVNLSAETLMLPDLAERIMALLENYQVEGKQLELEVIEDAIKGDIDVLSSTLQQLVDRGIRLSIDDFGTGCSSLMRLKRLPFSKLKIDRSFIRDLPNEAEDCAITLSILGLAQGLGLEVVAEGVETAAQEAWLRQQGCDFLQGFRYYRPEPVAALWALRENHYSPA